MGMLDPVDYREEEEEKKEQKRKATKIIPKRRGKPAKPVNKKYSIFKALKAKGKAAGLEFISGIMGQMRNR